MAVTPFTDLDEARSFVTKSPIDIPVIDQGEKRIKYSRVIRRTKEPKV